MIAVVFSDDGCLKYLSAAFSMMLLVNPATIFQAKRLIFIAD